MQLSVIIPCKNEAGNVTNICEVLKETLKEKKYELIFIDDGSTDTTLKELKDLYKKDKEHIRIVSFSRNFMKDAAMYAGLKKACGDYTCIIDGDMQQNPGYLLQMIDFLDKNEDYDQVAMVMSKKQEDGKTFIHKFSKAVFYKMIDILSDTKFVRSASDFRMFRNYVKDSIVSLTEYNRFSKGIFSWVGFKTHYMEYEVVDRKVGKTKFNFCGNFKYGIDGIIDFSIRPLRIATIFGIISSFAAFIYFIIIIVQTIIHGIDVPGYSSMMCIILLLGGIQLITIGILGEYVAKNYLETKRRPIYIAKEEIGFD